MFQGYLHNTGSKPHISMNHVINLQDRGIPDAIIGRTFYKDILMDLKEAKKIIE